MTRSLKFGRKAALSGKATSLVVFVHGYGANGADLLDLGDVMAPHLPGTAFVAPDAADRLPDRRKFVALPCRRAYAIEANDGNLPRNGASFPGNSCSARQLASRNETTV